MMTIEEALKHFDLAYLPTSTKALARKVGDPNRIATWTKADVEMYQLLFDEVLNNCRKDLDNLHDRLCNGA